MSGEDESFGFMEAVERMKEGYVCRCDCDNGTYVCRLYWMNACGRIVGGSKKESIRPGRPALLSARHFDGRWHVVQWIEPVRYYREEREMMKKTERVEWSVYVYTLREDCLTVRETYGTREEAEHRLDVIETAMRHGGIVRCVIPELDNVTIVNGSMIVGAMMYRKKVEER